MEFWPNLGTFSRQLRDISHQLHPSILDDLGLVAALKSLAESFERRYSFPARVIARDLPGHISLDLPLELYRIAQEALNNVVRHAGEDVTVTITLQRSLGGLDFSVADTGSGMDTEKLESAKGLGLKSMAERADLVGGSLAIESVLGQGTCIRVRVPLRKGLRTRANNRERSNNIQTLFAQKQNERSRSMAEPEEQKISPSSEEEDLEPGSVETSAGSEVDLSPPRGHTFPVVGIGGSAGGLDAFTRLLHALPNDTDMAFVIVQHLDPHHTSHLADILTKSTSMPVRNVEDGIRIEPNEVYVIPPNRTMVLEDGVLRLVPRDPGVHLPVDAFFTSLARVQGSRAIGVILSGNASDGSQGVKAIKEDCGLTFAQDEASAQHIGMPRNAIATGAIDYILPPADIARELGHLSRHPYIRTQSEQPQAEILPQGDGELAKIFKVLRNRTRVDFSHYKANTIRRRIGRRMIIKRAPSLHDYVQVLERDPMEARELFRDFLISFTSFFRDPDAFDALGALLKDALETRSSSEPFRVWVPGCASGEEVYSLAVCLSELNEKLEIDTPPQLFGTDISDAALEKARAGIYPDSITQDVSAERLRQFFTRVDRGFQITKSIRESCIFARQDLTGDPPFGHMDLISCRNLLIYLDSALQRRVLPIFHFSLNDTGLLFLGSAESIGEASDYFRWSTDRIVSIPASRPRFGSA